MRKVLITLLAIALFPLFPASASAAGADAPSWAEGTGVPSGFTWGNWFPCRQDYQLTDCVDSISWIKDDGTKIPGVWNPRPNFDFKTFRQTWLHDDGGNLLQQFDISASDAGTYSFDGLLTPCGDNKIVLSAMSVKFGFHVDALSPCGFLFKSKFEERFEVTIRSKYLKGFTGAISSNGKNPEMSYREDGSDQLLTVRVNFAHIAWNDVQVNGNYVDVCSKNEYQARTSGWGLWNTLIWSHMIGDTWLAQHPGDMITGTNGWNCGGFMYWDSAQEALVMQVGSPHYDVDGSVIDGWFEGAIRGRYVTARYGIKPQIASGNARLEIIYNNGEKKIATITAKYDAASDWLYLKGYGFTYSNPKLIVRFGNSAARKSITCIKGKVTKKITSTNPVCPVGFKTK
mgnify:CR=1 FL=1